MSDTTVRRRDYRLPTLLLMAVAVAALGYGFSVMPGRGVQVKEKPRAPDLSALSESSAETRKQMSESARIELSADAQDPDAPQARKVLAQADEQLRQRKYNDAIATLHNERTLMQKYAESYLLLGRALEGRKEHSAARDFYKAAIDRNPVLSEAYWGFATTSEELNDLESALGAMRSYLHTEPDRDPNRLKIAQARSAIWEWESKLGRGPWGPTKGVPPGFTVAELKRDGKGVGIKMPIPGTEDANGKMQYEIKSADKIQIFKR